MSLRDKILSQSKPPARTFTPEGFSDPVEVRAMTGNQRAQFLDFVSETKGEDPEAAVDLREFYPLLVLGYVYDPDTGDRVFFDTDKAAILELPGSALEQIAKAVLELSGLDAGAEKRSRDGLSEASGGTTTPSPNA